ncbi:hypothetical protein RI367_000848 [Sorochytrium milnesiophthora]
MLKWIQSAASGNSQKQAHITSVSDIEGTEKYFGLENALYFCKPFRECVQSYPYLRSLSELAPSSFGLSPAESSDMLQSLLSGQAGRTPAGSADSSKANTPASSPQSLRQRTKSSHLLLRGKSSSNMASTSTANANGSSNGSATNGSSGSTLQRQNSSAVINVAGSDQSDNLLGHLRELFIKIASQKKRTGVIAPTGFVKKLKDENLLFRTTAQQDAHEFLNYILNGVADILNKTSQTPEPLKAAANGHTNGVSGGEGEKAAATEVSDRVSNTSSAVTLALAPNSKTWIHELFEGELANETRCLTCETVTKSSECFLDLSIDIEPNSSISSCLLNFSRSEMLCHRNKFFCDTCSGLQEAERMMKVKRLPPVLALHLKRFKQESMEATQKFSKLMHRVVFPMELRLFNTSDDAENPDREYCLFAVVVHIGSTINHGHYIAIVKSADKWMVFDDDNVELVNEASISKYFGDPQASTPSTSASGYILFYQAKDIGISALSKRQLDANGKAPSMPSIAVNGRNGDLEHAFRRWGNINDVYIPREYRSGRPRGFAYIEFDHSDDARRCVDQAHDVSVAGQRVVVTLADSNRKSTNLVSTFVN